MCIFRGFKGVEKREGSGPHNWGNWTDDIKEEKKYAEACLCLCSCQMNVGCASVSVVLSHFPGVLKLQTKEMEVVPTIGEL